MLDNFNLFLGIHIMPALFEIEEHDTESSSHGLILYPSEFTPTTRYRFDPGDDAFHEL